MYLLNIQMIFQPRHPNGGEYPDEGGTESLARKYHNQGQSIIRNWPYPASFVTVSMFLEVVLP